MSFKRHNGKFHSLIWANHHSRTGWEYLNNENIMEKIEIHFNLTILLRTNPQFMPSDNL